MYCMVSGIVQIIIPNKPKNKTLCKLSDNFLLLPINISETIANIIATIDKILNFIHPFPHKK